MNYQSLKYVYQASGKPGAYTLLLLHGTGGDENDLLPIGYKFGSDINILSLRGNVLEHGMPRFFKRLGMGVFDEADLTFRTHEMVHFIKELSAKEGFDAGKLIALGYSNGANIAAATLFLYPGFLAGAILYRPMQPFKQMPVAEKMVQTPVFSSNGNEDPTINPQATRQFVALLKERGFKSTHYDLNTSHNLTQQDLQLSQEWFAKHFK